MNTGNIEIYAGTQPGSPEIAPTGALLGTCVFGNTAFGAAVDGLVTANAITADTNADATNAAGMFRIVKAGDTGVLGDGTCGQGAGDLSFDNNSIIAGGTIDITGFTITVPE
jgi:hypothetical protein